MVKLSPLGLQPNRSSLSTSVDLWHEARARGASMANSFVLFAISSKNDDDDDKRFEGSMDLARPNAGKKTTVEETEETDRTTLGALFYFLSSRGDGSLSGKFTLMFL